MMARHWSRTVRAPMICAVQHNSQERIMTEQATPIAHDSHDSEQDTRQFPYTITEKLQDTLRQALDSAESPRDLGVA